MLFDVAFFLGVPRRQSGLLGRCVWSRFLARRHEKYHGYDSRGDLYEGD